MNNTKNTSKIIQSNTKPSLKPCWFVEAPIDCEHKFYILKDFIQKIDKIKADGFIVDAFKLIQQRYKDLVSFSTSYKLINDDEETNKLLKYLYSLPPSANEHDEIIKIIEQSLTLLKKEYSSLTNELILVYDNVTIDHENISDKRKATNIYIEKCNSKIYEHFIVKRNKTVTYKESFMHNKFIPDTNENNVVIKTSIAYNSEDVLIPLFVQDELNN